MLTPIHQKQFEKDLKKIQKRGKEIEKLKSIITKLLNGESLPVKHRDHKLKGEFEGCWECHIEPDWLLIYEKTPEGLLLIRTGTHSDLFG